VIFTYFFVLISLLHTVYFVVPSSCGVFCFPVFVRCILFSRLCAVFIVSGWRIISDLVQIQSMSTLMSSTLHIWRHGYSRHFNIVIFIGLCNLPFYAINTDTVSFVRWFIPFVFSDFEFVLHRCTPTIWMNEYCLFWVKKKV
jgi:hypothetical protein